MQMKLNVKTQSERGSVKVLLMVVGGLAMLVVIAIIYLVSTYNTAARMENGVVAVHEDMKNVHASIFNTMKSQGLSIEKYGDTVIKALDAAMNGRYGADGVKGAMVWIQEQNPTIDASLYSKLQTVIESGYTRFEATQRSKIDRLRVYDNFIDTNPGGAVAKAFGYPKKVTADMRQTISTAETKEMMATKEMKTIDPFAK
jgi:hypothetical protein